MMRPPINLSEQLEWQVLAVAAGDFRETYYRMAISDCPFRCRWSVTSEVKAARPKSLATLLSS
jgi:hypothetical protein